MGIEQDIKQDGELNVTYVQLSYIRILLKKIKSK